MGTVMRSCGKVVSVVLAATFAAVLACGGDTLDGPDDGSGGAGGSSGGQGPLGSAGTGGVEQGECGCLQPELTWLSPWYIYSGDWEGDSSHVECMTYRRDRRRGPASVFDLCTGALECQGDGESVGTLELAAALRDEDVVAAIDQAPVFYGSDPRSSNPDVTILQIIVGEALIEVGADCGDYPSCTPAPDGVVALAALLRRLDEHELAVGDCAARCPDYLYQDHLGEPCSKYGRECPSDNRGCGIVCKNGSWAVLEVGLDFECGGSPDGGAPGIGGAGGAG